MTQVNLLPPEVRAQRRSAAATGKIKRLSVMGLILLGGIYAIRSIEVIQLNSDIKQVRADAAVAQAEIDSLASIQAAQNSIEAGEVLETALWRGEVSWSALLLQISSAVPPGFDLTSLSAQAAGGEGPTIGTVTFAASASNSAQPRLWLQRIASEEGWANGWLGSVQEESPGGKATVNGSFDLTPDAITPRGGGPA